MELDAWQPGKHAMTSLKSLSDVTYIGKVLQSIKEEQGENDSLNSMLAYNTSETDRTTKTQNR